MSSSTRRSPRDIQVASQTRAQSTPDPSQEWRLTPAIGSPRVSNVPALRLRPSDKPLSPLSRRNRHLLRQGIAHVLERERQRFLATDDSFVVWHAIALCRRFSMAIPDWVWAEVDKVGCRFVDALQIQVGTWSRDVAAVFGVTRKGARGPQDPFERWWRYAEDELLAMRVRMFVDGGGLNETNATSLVAEQQGVSRSTVRRADSCFHDLVRSVDLVEMRMLLLFFDQVGGIPNAWDPVAAIDSLAGILRVGRLAGWLKPSPGSSPPGLPPLSR